MFTIYFVNYVKITLCTTYSDFFILCVHLMYPCVDIIYAPIYPLCTPCKNAIEDVKWYTACNNRNIHITILVLY